MSDTMAIVWTINGWMIGWCIGCGIQLLCYKIPEWQSNWRYKRYLREHPYTPFDWKGWAEQMDACTFERRP